MLRDTLDMLPVAVILAVILGLGARTDRANDIQRGNPVSAVETMDRLLHRVLGQNQAGLVGGASARFSISIDSPGRDLPSTLENPRAGRTTTGDASTPILFLPRHSAREGVPFFTSSDIASGGEPMTDGGDISRDPARPPVTTTSPWKRDVISHPEPGPGVTGRNAVVDINGADPEGLASIPGIGRARASMIVAVRPPAGFRNWTEIDALPGIGPGTLSTLQRHAVLGTGGDHPEE